MSLRIFIVEGIVTIVFSIFTFIFIPNFPAQDKWLSDSDRTQLLARLQADKGEERQGMKVPMMKLIFEYKIWLM